MAQALKCDRCKNFYEPYEGINQIKMVDHRNVAIRYDLCPKCVTELKEWLDVVRCEDCMHSSQSKSMSRLELYCNNYDVLSCDKEQK